MAWYRAAIFSMSTTHSRGDVVLPACSRIIVVDGRGYYCAGSRIRCRVRHRSNPILLPVEGAIVGRVADRGLMYGHWISLIDRDS